MLQASFRDRLRSVSLAILVCPLLVAFVLGSNPAPVQAQEAPDEDANPWAGVEEMIVTSEGVLAGLTKSSVAVTAFDASELESIGASDVSDVAAFTPNLEIRTAGSTAATLFIRGVGLNDLTANATTSVAVYVDDAPKNLPAFQLGQLFDVDGVTVLKGPQASGPGRNASAGAIRIYTRKPTGDFGGYLRTDYGNYDALDLEGALEVPIIPDILSTRMSFRLEKRDGFITNRCGELTQAEIDAAGSACGEGAASEIRPGLQKDLNNVFKWATRMTTAYTPVADMTWMASIRGGRIDHLGPVGENLGAVNRLGSPDGGGYQQPEISAEQARIFSTYDLPNRPQCRQRFPGDPVAQAACVAQSAANRTAAGQELARNLASRPLDQNPYEGSFNNPGYERQTTWGGTLTGTWDLESVQLKSITSYDHYDRERLLDFDYSPNVIFEFEIEDEAWQVSQDLQLSGELERLPLRWDTGLFALGEELDYTQFTLAQQPGPVEPRLQAYIQRTASFGAFADVEIDFLDDFTFEAGARYNWERKELEADIVVNDVSDRCLPDAQGNVPECDRTITVDHPTYTVGLRYRLDVDRTVYLKYSHGWKGAQFNVRAGTQARAVTDVADPEVIDAFETGFDSNWWDGRLQVAGAFFWYSYQDYQVFTFTNDANVPPQRIVVNANDALLFGAELETTLEPIEGLKGVLRFGWLESRFLDFTDSVIRRTENAGNTRIITDFNGNSLPNAPRFKVSGSLQYAMPLGRIGTLTPRWEFTWTDDVNFDPSGGVGSPSAGGEIFMPENTIGQKAFMLHNLRVTFAPESADVEISGWVRNLTNEVYKSLSFDASAAGIVGNLLGEPRTYGLSAKVSF